MFVREKTSPTTKNTYLQVCESYRNEEGKPRNKVLLTLGALDSLVESGKIEALIKSLSKFLKAQESKNVSLDSFKELARYQWGGQRLLKKLWDTFDFDSLFASLKTRARFDFASIIFLLILDRFLIPRSKLQSFNKRESYWGIDKDFGLQHVYRSLNILANNKDKIENFLFEKNRNLFNMKVDAVFFDATTIYFESQKMDEFRKFGYSKDGKYGEVQIVVGLLMDQDGRPIGIEFYPGNTFDGHTLKQGLESLKNKFSINEVIIIADRGMCSYENLKAITDLGMDYIIGSTLKRKTAALKKDILDIASYEDVLNSNDEVFKYKEISIQTKNDDQSKEAKKERLIVTWSQARAKRDAKNREILIEKANKIASGEESVKKPGKARYLKSSKEETKYEVDQEKIKRDEKWDGFYGIQTSCKNKTKEEVYSLYRKLWKIEDCFRMLKSHLELRPVYHWNEDRIKGHLVLCFLTFVLERHLEITAKGTGLQLSPLKIRELIAGLEASLVTIENQKFLLRAAIPEDAKKLLKVFSIQEPSNLTLAKEF